MPAVSVIIPVYNVEKHLKKCIDSVLNQSFKDYEIILVDDGSTDSSSVICDEYANKNNNVIVKHKENGGVTSARNVGLALSKGGYISFVDSDDWVDVDFLQVLVNNLEKYNADIVAMGCIIEKEDLHIEKTNKIASGVYEAERLPELYKKMLYYTDFFKFGITQYLWNKLYKRETIEPFCNSIDPFIYDGEDVGILFPALLNAKKIVLIDDLKYHYFIRSDSVTAGKKSDFCENVALLHLHLINEFKKTEYYDIMLPQLNQYFRMMAWQSDKESFLKLCE